MKSIVNRIVVVVMVGALTSVAAFAKTHKQVVTFDSDIKVNGTVVKKGTYQVKFDDESGQLSINKNGKTIAQTIGDMMLFGLYFHELFVRGVINELVPAHLQGAKLSPRERQCLTMAAHGLAGEDIALKLSVSLRTVQHHFDSIRSKLGAANRLEAVVIGLSRGIISL